MVLQESPVAGRFLLTPRPVQMSQHADGEADDLPPSTVTVYLDAIQNDWPAARQTTIAGRGTATPIQLQPR